MAGPPAPRRLRLLAALASCLALPRRGGVRPTALVPAGRPTLARGAPALAGGGRPAVRRSLTRLGAAKSNGVPRERQQRLFLPHSRRAQPRQRLEQRWLPNAQGGGRHLSGASGGRRLAVEEANEEPGLNGGHLLDWAAEVELRERLWTEVFDDPGQWLDFRALKESGHAAPGHPDFQQRLTGERVWANSFFAPPWVAAKLAASTMLGLTTWPQGAESDLKAETWQQLFQEPKGWLDYREQKAVGDLQPTHPDFRRDGQVLRVSDPDTPEWVPARLQEVDEGESLGWRTSAGGPWSNLFDMPAKWRDYRAAKAAGEFAAAMPDFVHHFNGHMLWIEHMPKWAAAKLEAMDQVGIAPWTAERRTSP